VGGLSVLKELIKTFPDERFVYYGDTQHLPYGPRLLREVRKYVFEIISFLMEEKDVRAVVIACNTATSAALSQSRKYFKIPIFGTVSSAVKKAVQETENGRIGIIGTEGTVNSQSYQRALLKQDSSLEVFSAACPGFVPMVEEGRINDPKVVEMAHKYMEGLKRTEIDTLILGCTHFPYLTSVIRLVMGKKVKLIDPAEELAALMRDNFAEEHLLKRGANKFEKKELKKESQFEFIVSDRDKISDLLWQSDLVKSKESANIKEINIFSDEEEENV
jgi:glutamate racemase